MKRLNIILLLISVVSLSLYGQKFSIGIKPGFLVIGAKYSEEPALMGLSLSSRSSYCLALTFKEQINKILGVKLEPGYMAKGYNINYGSDGADIFINNYLSLPVLIQISPIPEFSFEAGPDFSYLISSGVKPAGDDSFQKNDSPDLKKMEFSFITGVCYSFLNRFDIGARYGIGLSACEKGTLMILDWQELKTDFKFVQHYFGFYLNARFINIPKGNH